VERWFDEYGFWVVGVAAFSPIPYKLATITAGTMSMSILPFIIISLIARGARYYLVAALVRAYGKQCDKWLQKYIDRLGYALIAVIVIGAWYAS
jgi:Predicted membrane protein